MGTSKESFKRDIAPDAIPNSSVCTCGFTLANFVGRKMDNQPKICKTLRYPKIQNQTGKTLDI